MNRRNFLIIFAILFSSSFLFAQNLMKQQPVSLKFVPAEKAKPGSTVQATIEVTIQKPWHIFGENPGMKGITPSQFTLDSSAGATLDSVTLSKPTSQYNPVFEKTLLLYEEKMTVTLNLKLAADSHGEIPLKGTFQYQACSDKLCLPPRKEPFSAAQPLE